MKYMKMKIKKKDIWLFALQLVVVASILLLSPLAVYLTTRDFQAAKTMAQLLWYHLQSPMILYFVNFYLFVPFLLYKHRYKTYGLANIALLVLLNIGIFQWRKYAEAPGVEIPTNAWMGFLSGMFVYFLLNLAAIAAAITIRHIIKTREISRQLLEEKQKNSEAELAWLKNQINPHFLFNTLNNISSLTQIDPDKAQESIAQMSDLLRYALYETNKKVVPINGEVEFMRNYIELMKLRCNDQTTIETLFDVTDSNYEIAPLLFISIIENAFKHGVSNSKPSHISIQLTQKAENLVFICDNTNYPKGDSDRSGSGIGIENTRRRLQLMYGDNYDWEQLIDDNNIYHVKITIKQ